MLRGNKGNRPLSRRSYLIGSSVLTEMGVLLTDLCNVCIWSVLLTFLPSFIQVCFDHPFVCHLIVVPFVPLYRLFPGYPSGYPCFWTFVCLSLNFAHFLLNFIFCSTDFFNLTSLFGIEPLLHHNGKAFGFSILCIWVAVPHCLVARV